MKKYTVRARLRKASNGLSIVVHGREDDMRNALQQFPLAVEARNKEQAKEIGEAVLGDLNLPKMGALIVEAECGW